MILSAQSIKRRCINDRLLSPFIFHETKHGVSAGISHSGYDLRVVLPNLVDQWEIRPGEFLLAATVEYFEMPYDLVAIVHDKSTLARQGLSVFNTVIEAGWCGYLTLELVNHGPEPITIYSGQGIAQVVFHVLDMPTERPYSGKYQDQGFGPQGAIRG